jgi:hypothetical protein
MKSDGTYVGRAAPEIDALEATVTDGIGYVGLILVFFYGFELIFSQVSLSAQFAPFNVRNTKYA